MGEDHRWAGKFHRAMMRLGYAVDGLTKEDVGVWTGVHRREWTVLTERLSYQIVYLSLSLFEGHCCLRLLVLSQFWQTACHTYLQNTLTDDETCVNYATVTTWSATLYWLLQ